MASTKSVKSFYDALWARREKSGNFISMEGGSYQLDEQFLRTVYLPAVDNFSATNPGNLVFKSPGAKPQPIFIDLDIEVENATINIRPEAYIRFAKRVVDIFGKTVELVIAKRPNTYHKKTKTKDCFRAGCHIYLLGRYTLSESVRLRKCVLQQVGLVDYFPEALNSFADVFDCALANRSNGLVLLGGRKRNGVEPYFICYHSEMGVLPCGWHKTKKDVFDRLFLKIYNWMWEPFDTPITKPITKPTKPKPSKPTKQLFDLDEFLRVTAGVIPGNTKYKQFCSYFARVGLDPHETQRKCNAAWKPEDRTETARIMSLMSTTAVTKASLIMWLNYNATIGWDESKIWPPSQELCFYNDYTKFTLNNMVYDRFEIQEFLKQCVLYITSVKKYVWKYYTTVTDRSGNEIRNVAVVMDSNPPFFKTDDLIISVRPTRRQILDDIEGRLKEKPDLSDPAIVETRGKLLQLQQKLNGTTSSSDAYNMVTDILGDRATPPDQIKMSKLLHQMHLNTKLSRQIAISFHPYRPGGVDPTSQETYNTFSGFHMADYKPTETIDIKQTLVWEYFVKVFGFGKETNPQLVYMLDFVAHMLQFPAQRSGRIILIVSNKRQSEGTGKSFLFGILNVIFEGYSIFHDSLDPYLGRFNFVNNSKKVIWVDDIFGASIQQTRRIFPKVTSSKQGYEKKGETIITMPEYSELWITSNQEAPLYIKPGDRRQLIFKASELLQQNDAFFKRTAAQLQNLDVQKALFEFFLRRDIAGFRPSSDPPNSTKSDTIASCMSKTHRFFANFFQDDEWHVRYKPYHTNIGVWFSQFVVKRNSTNPRKGEICLRISTNRLYLLYKSFMKELYPSSSVRDTDTFFKEAEMVGVVKRVGRQKIRKSCTSVCDVYFRDWYGEMGLTYPGFKFVDWAHEHEQFGKKMEDMVTNRCGDWMD